MQLLLDTHAMIWFVTGSSMISQKAKTAIQNTQNDCFLSIASLWELSIKISLGKFTLNMSELALMNELRRLKIDILPIAVPHTQAIISLPMHHRDPFDRMLIAQAMVDGLTIVSADTKFSKYKANILW